MLKINNLEVATDNKIILKDFNLIINDGEIHTIMGPNGVGKSTLSRVIMGDPNYKVLNGEMTFNGDNLMVLSTDERVWWIGENEVGALPVGCFLDVTHLQAVAAV